MSIPDQEISLQSFDGTVDTVLGVLNREPINDILQERDPYRQLRYIVDYLRHPQLGAKSFLSESHYVDRDYMEDHGVFYSRSLNQQKNYCKRLHFFSLPLEQLTEQIKWVAQASGEAKAAQTTLYETYLGFVVVKPLLGAPIGRTVLKPLPHDKGDGHLRKFGVARRYQVHLLGFTLTTVGLAFQQQDEGVSACATTAVWSALQKIRDFEDIRVATPAEITSLATRHVLPYGRAMPQEGLSIDQMCQAIQALGLAPSLYRVDAPDDLFSYLHAAERSNFPSILVLDAEPKNARDRHAVAVVGVKILPSLISPSDGIQDLASGISGLYVHDDRIGPYVLFETEKGDPRCFSVTYPRSSPSKEKWWASYLLLPVHPKIRISLATLRKTSRKFAVAVRKAINGSETSLSFEFFIQQGHRYVEDLCNGAPTERTLGIKLAAECALPRYLGVIRVATNTSSWIDLLLDTTCTPRNIECVAVICYEKATGSLTAAASKLASVYACRAFTST